MANISAANISAANISAANISETNICKANLSMANISVTNIVQEFAQIQTTYTNVCSIFQEIKQKLADLNNIYIDVVKTHTIKEYTFGLDAFNFQSKLIAHEYANMQNLLKVIVNQFYCEYYKLYKIVREYVHNEMKLNINIESNTVLPVYKDLDKKINYDFTFTVEIQSIIIKYINALHDYLRGKNKELNNTNTRQTKCGINIEHIVHYQSFTNALLTEQIMMFIRYMNALNRHHMKYITRLYSISKDLIDDVNAYIVTEETSTVVLQNDIIKSTKEAKKEPIICKSRIQNEVNNNISFITSEI